MPRCAAKALPASYYWLESGPCGVFTNHFTTSVVNNQTTLAKRKHGRNRSQEGNNIACYGLGCCKGQATANSRLLVRPDQLTCRWPRGDHCWAAAAFWHKTALSGWVSRREAKRRLEHQKLGDEACQAKRLLFHWYEPPQPDQRSK